jgi:hypothetical protein
LVAKELEAEAVVLAGSETARVAFGDRTGTQDYLALRTVAG